MINIAIIGFGVVGGGITEVIADNKSKICEYIGEELYVKKILDLRDFPDSPYADRVVHDIEDIVRDDCITVVCETMGGVEPAFTFTKKLLESGKSVVTSNKELVAKCGALLMEIAAENGVYYLYEAAVGGGIPEIRSMRGSLAGDTVSSVEGIVNGTTNYILTRMKEDGADFESALSEAKRLGYAERDPSADIDAIDAQRKIMILTAVATGYIADEKDVYTETLRNVTPLDMDAAVRIGASLKLIAKSDIEDDGAHLFAVPMMVMKNNPLSFVDGVYNAIRVISPVTQDVMFYGRGAGRMPTAGAVVEDVISAASGMAKFEKNAKWQNAPAGYVLPFESAKFSYYVRLCGEYDKESLALTFGKAEMLPCCADGYTEFITDKMTEKEIREILNSFGTKLSSAIRILN